LEQSNLEMGFYFWIGNGEDTISVTEEEFNQLYEAKRKLQNDYLNVVYDDKEDLTLYEAELGYN